MIYLFMDLINIYVAVASFLLRNRRWAVAACRKCNRKNNVMFLVINRELVRGKCNEIAASSGKDGEEERKWVKGASRGGNCGG